MPPPGLTTSLSEDADAGQRITPGSTVAPLGSTGARPAAGLFPADAERASARLVAWLHYGGWAVFSVIILVGLLSYPAELFGMLFHRSIYLVGILGSTFVVRAQCRALWQRGGPWQTILFKLVGSAYALSFLSMLAANLAALWRWPGSMTLSSEVLTALASTSGCCFLLAWAGVYFAAQHASRTLRFEALAREAELRALRYQLTPHFLCNTLNGISTLVGENRPQDARRMIARLGDFLRTTLDGGGASTVPLSQEIAYAEQYLAIEQARLGERLRVHIVVEPDALDAAVPNLLLQPLVENAVQHGIVPYPDGGKLTVHAQRAADRVRIVVRNEHAGPPPSPAAPAPVGLGLQNTAERLRLAAGADGVLSCQQDDAGGWTATVELRYRSAQNPCGS